MGLNKQPSTHGGKGGKTVIHPDEELKEGEMF